MSNIIIGFRNLTTTATLTGGSWLAGLPVTNVGTPALAEVARSTNALTTSTKILCDFGTSKTTRVFALVNHNCSAAATWRVKLGSTSGGAEVYDSGALNVWTMTFDDILEWEDATWWIGAVGDEYLRSPFPAMHAASQSYTARYLTIEITDTGNADGYVQVGRLFAGAGVQPTYNMSYGFETRWTDLSTSDYADSGARWSTVRRKVREANLVLNWLAPEEAKYMHELQRLSGTTEEVVYLPFPADMDMSQRLGFHGHLHELTAIEHPFYNVWSLPIKLRELV